MTFIYASLIFLSNLLLKCIAPFNKKIKLFVDGRKKTFALLKQTIEKNDRVIWMHCASLGEFEQGRILFEKLKEQYSDCKMLLTFFSPSGYEVQKNYSYADVVCYLPLDSNKNVIKFLDFAHPELVIFIKYEIWPNLLKQLKNRQINTLLVSGVFDKKQIYFKWYGGFMRKSLLTFQHFFVQDKNSKDCLGTIGIDNVTVNGDTRFDRVFEISQQEDSLDFIKEFKNNKYTLVAGSTWKKDEQLLVDYINIASDDEQFIIAPHNINTAEIAALKKSIQKKTVLFSEKSNKKLADYQVFVVDTIGILTQIYAYADIAYVGGGFTNSGIHNVLEPAAFGIPIIIGPNYKNYLEAVELVKNDACFVIDDSQKLSVFLSDFYNQNQKRLKTGENAYNYVLNEKGATTKILNYITNLK